jgi:glycosyltransferase involved in cell wall biosynthesis
MHKPMQVLLLARYGARAASTRHRFLQYLPALKTAGIQVTVSVLLDDAYLEQRLEAARVPVWSVARGFARRLRDLLTAGAFDVVVVHCEIFPYLPAWFEQLLRWRRIPYIVDFDDAIFHKYDQHRSRLVRRFLGDKIARALAGSSAVIAGNEYLASYARRWNDRVETLPTVVDVERYRPRLREKAAEAFTIGWIGSPSTAQYVTEIQTALHRFFEGHGGRMVMVGSGFIALTGVPLEVHSWSEARELDELTDFDVGIMPLPDTPWTRGKSGFKLVQYMAMGLPIVASPVGVNATLVEHGVDGFLAASPADWLNALMTLALDRSLRTTMGDSGRMKVERLYSLQSTTPRLVALLKDAGSRS